MAGKLKDIAGQKFGRLTVIYRVPHDGTARVAKWLCVCECGHEHIAFGNHLRSGVTTECTECWRSKRPNRYETKTRLYGIWTGMRKRCQNEAVASWKHYGAKGIAVCDEWQDYQAFKAWALTHGYANDLTIERINPNIGYIPSNCEWITKSENSRRCSVLRWAREKGKAA
jgi:hypothetical protein